MRARPWRTVVSGLLLALGGGIISRRLGCRPASAPIEVPQTKTADNDRGTDDFSREYSGVRPSSTGDLLRKPSATDVSRSEEKR